MSGRIATVVSLGAVFVTGCAQIATSRTVETVVAPGARPIRSEDRVSAVALEARWSQQGRDFALELREIRSCRLVEHLPVREIERVTRTPDGMLFWEYGLAAAALGVSALAFARPELLAVEPTYDPMTREYRRDPKTGYRLGGVFTGIGVGFLTAAIVDTVRARDRVATRDVVAVREGPVHPCDPPDAPAAGRSLELVVGDRALPGVTDADGRVRFILPEMSSGTDEPPRTIAAAVRLGLGAALPISLVVPYAHTADAPHTGAVRSEAR
ncbi:MAG TPA: hypothetical protein VIK91_08820 [Nannocystis sp.]